MEGTMDIMNATSMIREIEGEYPEWDCGEQEPRRYQMYVIELENGLKIRMDFESAKHRYVGEKVKVRVSRVD